MTARFEPGRITQLRCLRIALAAALIVCFPAPAQHGRAHRAVAVT